MTARHTPGPWVVDGPPHDRIVWCEGTDNRICFIAHSDGADNERVIATSNLIAAAPELAEALAAVLADIQADNANHMAWRSVRRAEAVLKSLSIDPAATPEGPAA